MNKPKFTAGDIIWFPRGYHTPYLVIKLIPLTVQVGPFETELLLSKNVEIYSEAFNEN